jgi:hypothetical protein
MGTTWPFEKLRDDMFKLVRDPLFHFLLAGVVLFSFATLLSGSSASTQANIVTVDKAALVGFLESRSPNRELVTPEDRIQKMSVKDRQALIAAFVREEALHREAQALGLHEGDFVIRQRLVRKMEYLAEASIETPTGLTDEEARAYFATHETDYQEDASITFTHVFLDANKHGPSTLKMAEEKLVELRAVSVEFSDAPKHGDRFLYLVNYVGRTPDYVGSHFGPLIADELFADAPLDQWLGPLQSPFGHHLFLVTKRSSVRRPSYEEVRARVERDLQLSLFQDQRKMAIQEIIDNYTIEVVYGAD